MASNDFIRGNPGLKSANVSESITREELQRRIIEISKCKKDPVYFANNYYTIISPSKGKHIIETYPKQDSMLKTFIDNKRVICCSSRQIGKCVSFFTWITIKHKIYDWMIIPVPIGLFYYSVKIVNNVRKWFSKG